MACARPTEDVHGNRLSGGLECRVCSQSRHDQPRPIRARRIGWGPRQTGTCRPWSVVTKTYVNPHGRSVRLELSDGSEVTVKPWGMVRLDVAVDRMEYVATPAAADDGDSK